MSNTAQPSAKDRVLSWVRKANPQTMELKFGCKLLYEDEAFPRVFTFVKATKGNYFLFGYSGNKTNQIMKRHRGICEERYKILGSDMGLQELLIAFGTVPLPKHLITLLSGNIYMFESGVLETPITRYDLLKNLHDQKQEFYESILPLIS